MSERDAISFDVTFDAEGRSSGKFRNDITVQLRGLHAQSFELPTDEGPKHGGDGTAPYPLAYFASALTGCLMTQLRAFAKRLRLPLRGVSVKTRCHWAASQRGDAPYESAPVAFTLDVDIDADASDEDKRRLLLAAQKGCFVEQSLKPGIARHRLKLAGRWEEV
jgi:uncharacterized OsmC-like protein